MRWNQFVGRLVTSSRGIPAAVLVLGSIVGSANTFVPVASATSVACGTSNTPSVVALANPNFYIDSGISPALNATYGGYTVRAGTTAEPNLRIVLGTFTGGVVSLATNQPSDTTLPALVPGEVTTSYFLFKATGPTTTPQSHTITLYRGGTYLCERSFTYSRVAETIKALANKVDSVTAASNATASIGDELVVTVEGHTGTLGAGPTYDPGVLSYAPAAINGFPVNAWRLEKTSLTISPDATSAANTYVDRLFLSGASGADRDYVAKYTFRAIDATNAVTTVRPVQYIASGTQVKHTDLEGSITGTIPPISDTSKLSMTKSVVAVSPSAFMAGTQTFPPNGTVTRGGTVRYTVNVSNSGGTTGTLDRIVDSMQAGITFVEGSGKIAGRAKIPTIDGRNVIFYGPITVPAGGTTTLVYDAVVQDVTGSYVNSVVGWFGNARIDGSTSINQNSPASTTVVVAPSYGSVDAIDDSTSTSPTTSKLIAVLDNDIGTNLSVTIIRQPSGGTATIEGTSIRYAPSGFFGGADSFDYRITNGFTSDIATVTVNVPKTAYDEYVVAAPSGANNAVVTKTDAEGLLSNDTCSQATCQVQSVTIAKGTFALSTTSSQQLGGFTYTLLKADIPSGGTTVTFTYVLIDGAGNTATGNGKIVISDFGPDRKSTSYKTKVNIVVTTNDANCNPSPCAVQGVSATQPEVVDGTAVKFDANSIDYTPNAGFAGVDRFNYSKGNNDGTVTVLTAPPIATMTTSIGNPRSATIGTTDYISTHGLPIAAPLVAKYECTGCTYSVATPSVSTPAPVKGSVTFTNSATGAFTYTPAATSTGSDTFYYTVTEPTGITVNSSVTIQIGPDAVNDTAQMMLKDTLSFNVLTNDNCPTTCTVTPVIGSGPTSGTLTQSSPGSGSFTYSNSSAIGTFTFQYTVTSTQTGSLNDTATVSLLVQGAVNDSGITSPGIPLTMNVRANDPCDDCAFGSLSQPTVGTASVNTNGTVTYISPGAFSGIALFTYTVTKNGASSSATVTVTVKPDAKNDSISVLANSTNVVIDVLRNDICADCTITSRSSPTGGTATISTDKFEIRYDAPGSGGPFTFTYEITDVSGETDTATVTVTLAVGPTVVNDTSSTFAGRAVSINTRGNDTCTNSPCVIEIASDPGNGFVSLSVSSSYDVVYTPKPSFTGVDTFQYTLVTSAGLRATATVTVVVSPLASNDRVVTGTNVPIGIDVLANDVCTTCTVNVIGSPSGGTVVSVSGSVVTFTSPSPGTFTFDYKVIETTIRGAGYTSFSEISSIASPSDPDVSVLAPPSDPAEAAATSTIIVGDAAPDEIAAPYNSAPLLINVLSNDTCTSAGCTLASVDVSGGPATDTAEIVDAGAVDTTIRYTPAADTSGRVVVSYTATYGSTSATATVTILIGPAPIERTINKNAIATGNVLTGYSCATCTVSLKSFSGEGEIQLNSDGTYTYTSRTDWLGVDSPITYTITDSQSLSSPQLSRDGTITFTVSALTPSLLLTTTGVLDDGADNVVNVGDHIDFSYEVENTYTGALSNITVVDARILNDDVNIDCPSGGTSNVIASLPVGDTRTCVSVYYVTQQDIDSGEVTNEGTASGTGFVSLPAPGSNQPAVDTDSVTVSLLRIADTTVVKSASQVFRNASDPSRDKAGDTITYSYDVTNTGNVTLTNIAVFDDKILNDDANIDCPSGGTSNVISTLIPDQSVVCVATYTLTSDDVTSGSITNTVTVTATAPSGADDPLPSSSAITVLLNQPVGLSIAKSVSGVLSDPDSNGVDPGDRLTYSFLVTNTSTLATLTNISVTDHKIGSAIVCTGETGSTIASLTAGASRTCSATYAITQNDIDDGVVINTASVSSNYSVGGGVVSTISASDTHSQSVSQNTSLAIVNTFVSLNNSVITPGTRTDSGDRANFSYSVTNTGNVTLTSVLVSGTATTSVDCGSGPTISSLAPQETVQCSAAYLVTQSNINSGSVSNTGMAGASITLYGASNPTNLSVDSTSSTTFVQSPEIVIANSGAITKGIDNRSDAGDSAVFTYLITNTGNVTLSSVSVTSSTGTVDCDAGVGTSTIISALAPAATHTCTSTSTLTQSNINTGRISDTGGASSTFTRPDSSTVVASDDDLATVDIDQALNLAVDNTFVSLSQNIVAPSSRADSGDKASFTYVITNTGNVTLSSVSVTSSTGIVDCDAGAGTSTTISALAPAATHTCAATSTLTLTHINAGTISDTAQAVSSYTYRGDSNATAVTRTDDASTSITAVPALDIATTGVLNPAATPNQPNDTVVYTYTVTNTGNITLSNIAVTVDNQVSDLFDNTISTSDIRCDSGITNEISTLNPGAGKTCTATYSLSQAEINRGMIRNHVVGAAPNASGTYEFDKVINQSANLTISNTARSLVDNAPVGASTNDTIIYDLLVTNTGNVTLSNIAVTVPGLTVDCATITSLAPGAAVSCVTSTYTLTSADITAGSVTKTAQAQSSFTNYGQSATTLTRTDPAATYLVDASVALTKTAQVNQGINSRVDAGDTITYTFAVTNTGAIALSGVEISDTLISTTDIVCVGSANNVTPVLAPGNTTTCSATYVITQLNVDAGSVTNTATASSGSISDSDTVISSLVQSPGLTVEKTGILNNGVVAPSVSSEAGDTIEYRYVVTNSGNVTLSAVTVSDDKIIDDATILCPSGSGTNNVISSLTPGTSVTCSVVYTVTSVDITNLSVVNTVTVAANRPGSTPITPATDTLTLRLAEPASLQNNVDAQDDAVSAPMGAILEVDVLNNDVGTNLSIESVTSPNNGTAVIRNGLIEVTPSLLFTGAVNFTYVLTNGTTRDTASVAVTLTENLVKPNPEMFLDINANGIRETAEPGIKGVAMKLSLESRSVVRMRNGQTSTGFTSLAIRKASGSAVRSQASVAVETYNCATINSGFCNDARLPLGTYRVRADFNPSKYGLTTTADSDGGLDLEALSTPTGNSMSKVQFGVAGLGSISGHTYIDKNKNVRFDRLSDTPLSNSRVLTVWSGIDGTSNTDDDVTIELRTNSSGKYSLQNIPVGAYSVTASNTVNRIQLSGTKFATLVNNRTAIVDFRLPTDFTLPATGSRGSSHAQLAFQLMCLGFFFLELRRRHRGSRI